MPAIWSKFRAGKTAADKALAKHAGLEPDPEQAPPAFKYRHIPSHAQNDAIIGAPGCYKELDRQTIKRQSHRRSMQPINYGTYQKSNLTSCRTSWGDGDGRPMTERRMSKRVDSGVGSAAPSDWSSTRSALKYSNGDTSPASSSSQEDLPTMKRVRHRYSYTPDATLATREGRSAYRRAPPSIKLDTLSVCEMLHDNPSRKVGQAPRLDTPVYASRQVSPAALPATTEKPKKKRSWGFGKRMTRVAVA